MINSEETHYIYYYESDEGRQCWECTTCCSAGSVGEFGGFGDAELAAERSHLRDGITSLGITSRPV